MGVFQQAGYLSSWGLCRELSTCVGFYTPHLGVRLALNMDSSTPISNLRVHHQRAAVHTDTMEPPHLREEKTEVGRGVSNAPMTHREYSTDPGSEPQPLYSQPMLLH